MKRLSLALLVSLSLTALVAGSAAAQINYDAANHAYFVVGNGTINTNIAGNDVFVGKDNATNFATLPGTITLTVAGGANVTRFGNSFPGGPFGGSVYIGLNVHGPHIVQIGGGNVEYASSFNTGVVNLTGGVVRTVYTRDTSSLNLSGGTLNTIFGYGSSTSHISGGKLEFAYADNNSTINMTGGTARHLTGRTNGTVNISGGSLEGADVQAFSTMNLSGGTVKFSVSTHDNSTANISGGTMTQVLGHDTSTVNISGGAVKQIHYRGDGMVNLSGGIAGGTVDFQGIYQVGGNLNLFGAGFTRTNIVAGEYDFWIGVPVITGTYSTLTGTLLDGTPLNTTLFLADGQTWNDRGGSSQGNAVMPNSIGNGVFTFTDVPTGAWFDPPTVDSFLFTMTDGNLFTGILDFPTGFASAFEVRVGNLLLGAFGAGQAVNFADFGFGTGVSAFTIENIMPGVDAENPQGFPIRLGFSAPFASFTMQGFGVGSSAAPEPGTVGLVLLAGICAMLAGKTAMRSRA